MASKKTKKGTGKPPAKKSAKRQPSRTTRKAKAASREVRKSAKQIGRTAKTLKTAIKKVTKSFAKKQAKNAAEKELRQINRLLGEEYTSLSSARRALKRESKPIKKAIQKPKNVVRKKSAAKPAPQPLLKYPHPSTHSVVRYARKHGIPLDLNSPDYQANYNRVVSDPQFQASYEVMQKPELQKNKKAHGPFAQALEDFEYREDDADYDVGETPKEDAA